MKYARIAPTVGRSIVDTTTCTVDAVTVPVPTRTVRGGPIAHYRLCAALAALGYRPAGSLVDDAVDAGDWFDIAVEPLDGAP